MPRLPFGAILAGGQNSRYGSHKALATVGGRPIIERVQDALRSVTPDLILIANEPDRYASVGLPQRPDAVPGLGALGGIYSALLWARAAGRPGVVAVACDMPFLDGRLLARLVDDLTEVDIVVPESGGRRGVEPLCAYYATGCIPSIEAQIDSGERRVIGFYDGLRVRRIPLEEVRGIGEPELLFLNVNTTIERTRAEALVMGASADKAEMAEGAGALPLLEEAGPDG
jgi:molybdopterin-guanine dinucleotide biosynthesis protein A